MCDTRSKKKITIGTLYLSVRQLQDFVTSCNLWTGAWIWASLLTCPCATALFFSQLGYINYKFCSCGMAKNLHSFLLSAILMFTGKFKLGSLYRKISGLVLNVISYCFKQLLIIIPFILKDLLLSTSFTISLIKLN